MPMPLARLVNAAWMLSCQGELRAFHRATSDVAGVQKRLLLDMLRHNAGCDFGREHNFARITDPIQFQRQVPLCDYDNLTAAVDRIAAGEENVLTTEPVLLLQPTSGSTAGRKLLPYTHSLKSQYQRCVSAWVGDLFRRRPKARRGRAYWSISPALDGSRKTSGGLPIGFDDDAAYLGRWQWLVRRLLVTPGEMAQPPDIGEFRLATLSALVAAEDLSLISVWSPTFLLTLLDELPRYAEQIAHVLRVSLSSTCAAVLCRIARDEIADPDALAALWPKLALVSCWTDASATVHLRRLRQRLPHVEFQSKGIMATEACISFPLVDEEGCPLALRSTFLEFQAVFASGELDKSNSLLLAHELEIGGQYGVVITTGGGLYRYRLGDIVEVVGRLRQCPLVRFVGRAGFTSDLVGEKLGEPFVRRVVEVAISNQRLRPRFVVLIPSHAPPLGYKLYLQLDPDVALDECALAQDVECGLHDNPHYEYAVRLGQLAPVRVILLDPRGEPAWNAVERRALAAGQKLGDLKPTWLARGDVSSAAMDWAAAFEHLALRETGAA